MWEIVVPWYREGSSGADTSGEDYYDVSDEVAKSLQDERFVEPYIKKGWGWSYPDPERLIITLSGTEALHTYETDLYATACTLLRPGIHTDLSGTPARRSSGRDHWRSGRYFVDFDTPRGDVCRVYPEQCELVFPFEPEKQPVAA